MADVAHLTLAIGSDQVLTGTSRLENLTNAAKRSDAAVAGLERMAKRAGIALAALATGAFYMFIRSTIESEKVQAQLAAALVSTAGASGQTIESLNRHSAALQRLTTYDDEAIGGAQALLLTFTRISGETFPKATEAVLDLATRMGGDLKGAALQVGKALNDPVQGMTALTRSGIQFTDAQKAMVKQLVETGDHLGAQKIILEELETQFGGSAQAARGTLGGALKALQNAFGDLFEASGEQSVQLRKDIEELIKVLQSPEFVSSVQQFGSLVFQALSLISTGVINAANNIAWLRDIFNSLTGNIKAMSDVGLQEELGKIFEQRRVLEEQIANMQTKLSNGGMDTLFGLLDPAIGEGIKYNREQIELLIQKALEIYQIQKDRAIEGAPPQIVPPIVPTFTPTLTSDQLEKLEKAREAYRKIKASSEEFVANQELEARALGMSAQQANVLRYAHDMLNQARAAGVVIGKKQIDELTAAAEKMAASEERLRILNDVYEFSKNTFKSFFSDLKNDLMSGVSLWDAFANAGANALDRIADKALGMAADGIFDMIFGAIMNGITGSIGGGGSSWFPKSFLPNAMGNAFNRTGVISTPTAFGIGGGRMGVMGEAGEEAVMPLRRGPDGRLGVTAANSNHSSPIPSVTIAPQFNFNGSGFTESQAKRLMQDTNRDLVRRLPEIMADLRRRAQAA